MADVIFVSPNTDGDMVNEPIGTLILATLLHNQGIDVENITFHTIGDPSKFNDFIKNGIELISKKNPRIVSFYSRCDSFHISITLAKGIKELMPDTTIVFGGPQVTLCADETVSELPFIDYACCGEGELTVVPFFKSLLNNNPDLTIPGLVYYCNGTVHKNPPPEHIKDLDSVPIIDYDFIKNKNTFSEIDKNVIFPIDVGRGCPFGCAFCSTKTFWNRNYRLKSAERIIEEITYIHNFFGITHFRFEHDMFTMNRQKVIYICSLLKQLDFPIIWTCSARADCLDNELIDIMYDVGLRNVYVGIETGSPRMQKLLHKNLKLDNIVDLFKYLIYKGISPTASFIYGFPEETHEDVLQTLELYISLLKLKRVQLQMHLCKFFPGTELGITYKNDLIPFDPTSNETDDYAVLECSELITTHPNLFLQYREYHTELRSQLQYLHVFLKCFEEYITIYSYISKKYFDNNYLDAYFAWVKCNNSLLKKSTKEDSFFAILDEDNFLTLLNNDPLKGIAFELKRFVRSKKTKKELKNEVFMFCLDDYLSRKNLVNYSPGYTLVNTAFKNGKYVMNYQISHI